MFTLSGTISWVGKQAQLSAKPVSLGDGQLLIAHAITEGHIEPRGPGHPHSIPSASTPFNFHNQDFSFHDQQTSHQLLNDGRCPDLAFSQYIRSEVRHHSKARIEAGGNESYGWLNPSHLHSHQIMDSKVKEVQHQLLHQWHQCLRDWKVLGIHAVADGPTGNLEAI